MPYMQVALTQLNTAGAEGFAGLQTADLAYSPDSNTLGRVLSRAADLDSRIVEFIDSFPAGIQAAILGCLQANAARDKPLPVTFAWAPGYDYSLQLWDVSSTDDSTGGITVFVTSRYPGDAHPLSTT